ncbi:hypothetical protein VNO77_05544 [Canavalia gladiata]|uniref:Uncharacterized protein n=1 Tax=Canavalia gladiata TaxID=3824 RepID=A0AAN9MZ97_CANGL
MLVSSSQLMHVMLATVLPSCVALPRVKRKTLMVMILMPWCVLAEPHVSEGVELPMCSKSITTLCLLLQMSLFSPIVNILTKTYLCERRTAQATVRGLRTYLGSSFPF